MWLMKLMEVYTVEKFIGFGVDKSFSTSAGLLGSHGGRDGFNDPFYF